MKEKKEKEETRLRTNLGIDKSESKKFTSGECKDGKCKCKKGGKDE